MVECVEDAVHVLYKKWFLGFLYHLICMYICKTIINYINMILLIIFCYLVPSISC